jgi:hypothetical protein
MSIKHIKTRSHAFLDGCDLVYKPSVRKETTIYAVLIAFSQTATWGTYSGFCLVGEEMVRVESWGFFEHMHMRW